MRRLPARYPAVARSAQLIGGVQVQNRASLGGNICNAAPSADGVPALICLGAQALIAGPAGTREMPVEAIFAGPGRTKLGGRRAPGRDPAAAGAAVARPRPICASRRGAKWTSRWRDAGPGCGSATDGAIVEARLVLASVAPTPIRAPTAERKLVGERPGTALFEEAGRLAAQDARPISDTRGSADFRRTLVAVLTARALADCGRQLGLEVVVR